MTRTRHALSFEFWPEADRLAWAKALQDAELFGERGLAAHWADATRAQVMNGYGMWLHFLEAVGALQHDVMPTGRVRAERLTGYVESLKARSLSPVSVASRLRDLAEALRVMDPGGDRTMLLRGLRRLEGTASASRDKRRVLVAPGDIYEASIARMDAAERSASRGHILKALYFSDGLRTAMLAARAVRLRNLAGSRLGKNLMKVDDAYRWTFAATETKTGEVIDALLPPRLTPYIERWIDHHRRLLLRGAGSDALWISIKGSPMGRADVYERVCITTEQELGVRINPHAFRHILATGVAIALPEEVRLTPFLLDHRTERTTQECYNLADSLTASERYLERLETRRHQALGGYTRGNDPCEQDISHSASKVRLRVRRHR